MADLKNKKIKNFRDTLINIHLFISMVLLSILAFDLQA
jgi:hypothetical protein